MKTQTFASLVAIALTALAVAPSHAVFLTYVTVSVSPAGCKVTEATQAQPCKLRFERFNITGTPQAGPQPLRVRFSMSGNATQGIVMQSGDYRLEALSLAYPATSSACALPVNSMIVSNEICIPATKAVAEVKVVAVNDPTYEGDETIQVSLQSIGGYIPKQGSSTTILPLLDNDTTVKIEQIVSPALEAGPKNGKFKVSRPAGQILGNLYVKYKIGGTATYSTDYTLATFPSPSSSTGGTVLIRAGTCCREISVNPIPNPDTGQESVILTLDPGPTYTLGAPISATVYIRDQ
jgi:hypothetical protein